MKRYCIGSISDKNDFPEADVKEPFCINCRNIIDDVIHKNKQKQAIPWPEREHVFAIWRGLLGEYSPYDNEEYHHTQNTPDKTNDHSKKIKNTENEKIWADNWYKEERRAESLGFITQFDQIYQYPCYESDILKDTYLTLLATEGYEENLFFKNRRIKRGEYYDGDDIDEKMAETIRNRQKEHINSRDSIFDITQLRSTSKNTKTGILGINIKRLWLYDKDFRLLFAKAGEDAPKYDPSNIMQIIKRGNEAGLKYEADDYMILEKLFGIDMGLYIHDNIIAKMKAPDPHILLTPLINILMEYDGAYDQQLFLSHLEADLYMKQSRRLAWDEQDRIRTYTEILQDEIKTFKKIYTETIDTYIQSARINYTYATIKKELEKALVKSLIEIDATIPHELLENAQDPKDKINILYKDSFEKKAQQYASLKYKDPMRKIQRQIILKNCERYGL